MSETNHQGIHSIIERVRLNATTPETLGDECLDSLGPIEVTDGTKVELLKQANTEGNLEWDGSVETANSERRISEMLQLIVSTREYMFA